MFFNLLYYLIKRECERKFQREFEIKFQRFQRFQRFQDFKEIFKDLKDL